MHTQKKTEKSLSKMAEKVLTSSAIYFASLLTMYKMHEAPVPEKLKDLQK